MNSLPSSTKGYWKGSHYISQGGTGHWTKWGGGKKAALQSKGEDFWFCSSCGKDQPSAMPRYDFQIGENEYIKVCPKCASEGCVVFVHRVREIEVEI